MKYCVVKYVYNAQFNAVDTVIVFSSTSKEERLAYYNQHLDEELYMMNVYER